MYSLFVASILKISKMYFIKFLYMSLWVVETQAMVLYLRKVKILIRVFISAFVLRLFFSFQMMRLVCPYVTSATYRTIIM